MNFWNNPENSPLKVLLLVGVVGFGGWFVSLNYGGHNAVVDEASVFGCTQPTISATTASAVLPTSATIHWTTNQKTTSLLEISTSSSFSGASWLPVLNTPASKNGVTAHSYPASSLSPNTAYYYRVSSSNGSCESTSATYSLQTTAQSSGPDVTPPSIPAGLEAAAVASTGFSLSWNASTDPTVAGALTSGVKDYQIYGPSKICDLNGTSGLCGIATGTSFAVSGLAPATTYAGSSGSSAGFTVVAYDNAGNHSANSSPLSVTTTGAVAATTSCLNAVANPASARQMWVWKDVATDNGQLLVAGSGTYNDFFTFVDSHAIQTAYLYLPASFLENTADASELKAFLNVAKNQHCLSIEAVDGDADWVALPGNPYFTSGATTTAAIDFANAVKNFDASVPAGGASLIGLQYDVEPYSLSATSGYVPYWGQSTGGDIAIGNALLDMLQAVKTDLAGTGILLDIAPPRWYDTASDLTGSVFIRTGGGTGKSLMQYVLDIADTMTVQDYVVTAPSIYSDGQGELDYGATLGKTVRLGVDTAPGDGATTSFGDVSGVTCSLLNSTLSSAYALMTSSEKSAFGGFAIEYYKGPNDTPYAYSALCP